MRLFTFLLRVRREGWYRSRCLDISLVIRLQLTLTRSKSGLFDYFSGLALAVLESICPTETKSVFWKLPPIPLHCEHASVCSTCTSSHLIGCTSRALKIWAHIFQCLHSIPVNICSVKYTVIKLKLASKLLSIFDARLILSLNKIK